MKFPCLCTVPLPRLLLFSRSFWSRVWTVRVHIPVLRGVSIWIYLNILDWLSNFDFTFHWVKKCNSSGAASKTIKSSYWWVCKMGHYEWKIDNTDLNYPVSSTCHMWVWAISLFQPMEHDFSAYENNTSEVLEHPSIHQTDFFSSNWRETEARKAGKGLFYKYVDWTKGNGCKLEEGRSD